MLASWYGIVRSVVWMGDGSENQVNLIHEVGAAERQMQARAGVEHDNATVRILCAGVVVSHK
ncbi:MAG TPA: hypothetical protein VGY30_05970 [Solirubrobacteraceae bacterium]|jgi:hypothetical protein|nr:hypothetical protein [Solirubrobacteraceae bacterium]